MQTVFWILCALATWIEVRLALGVWHAWESASLYWLAVRLRGDPLVQFLVAEFVLLRFALFLIGLQLSANRRYRGAAAWLAFVPVFGAPLAYACAIELGTPANRDHADKRSTSR
ncbi:MAG: hypothetical protein D6761_07140 [Candidatus Dadabacteria bacterium]|nr:MAG: hypothetical protein D6761_07140 [Candidatus Dadabacteria bacterium]